MTWKPQYSNWAKENFALTGDFSYLNPGSYIVQGGKTVLLPNNFAEGTYVYNAPWDPVTGWNVNNTMDSDTIVSQDFSITDYNAGSHGTVGTLYGTAYYTSGDGSSVVYNGGEINSNNLTLEFKVRAYGINPTGSSSSIFSGDNSRHGIYIGTSGEYSFIEVLPSGLRIEGQSDFTIPGDFNSKLVSMRVTKELNDLTIMTSDGVNTFIGSGFQAHTTPQTGLYVSFGTHPDTLTSLPFDSTGNFHEVNLEKGTFEGITLWDDIKIANDQSVSRLPQSYIPAYPAGTKTIVTPEWYPNKDTIEYLGAYIKVNPLTGGTLTVQPQYKELLALTGSWQTPSELQIQISGPETTYFADLSTIPVFSENNSLRFQLDAVSTDGQPPQVEEIVVYASTNTPGMDIIPNWKESAFSKQINFRVSEGISKTKEPYESATDEFMLYNRDNEETISLGAYKLRIAGTLSGEIVDSSDVNLIPAEGMHKVSDGQFGGALQGFTKHRQYNGTWSTNRTYQSTSDPIFQGTLRDEYTPSPVGGFSQSGIGQAIYSIDTLQDLDGNSFNIQHVSVANYTGNHSELIGISLTGVIPPTGGNTFMGICQGIIQIHNGPGVWVSMQDRGNENKIFLDGNKYRQRRPFACAAIYSGDHTVINSNSYITIGVPSTNGELPELSESLYGDWYSDTEKHKQTNFTVYSITGSIINHCYAEMTGNSFTSYKPYQISDIPAIPGTGNMLTYSRANVLIPDGGNREFDSVPLSVPLFEGWIRPYGLKDNFNSTDTTIASMLDSSGNGMFVKLDRNGIVSTQVDMLYNEISGGFEDIYYSISGRAQDAIVWGDWNHIGVCIENKAYGDTVTNTFQPLTPVPTGHLLDQHGARSSKLYITINNKVSSVVDAGSSPYESLYVAADTLATNVPGTEGVVPLLPRIPSIRNEDEWRIKLGENLVSDYEYVRYGVRGYTDCLSDLLTKGSRATSPLISPKYALKQAIPQSGSVAHLETSHIYRFDEEIGYYGIDWGYSTSHLTVETSNDGELVRYGLDGYHWLQSVDGPIAKTKAVRIGPGTRFSVASNSFDERALNGPGSHDEAGGRIYDYIPRIDEYRTEHAASHDRYTSDSTIKMSAKVRLRTLPTQGVMDIMTYDVNGSQTGYGLNQVYLGVTPSGVLVGGSRINYDVSEGIHSVSGGWFKDDEWHHIGIEYSAPSGNGYIRLYQDGSKTANQTITGSTIDNLSPLVTKPIGYQKKYHAEASKYRLGGDIPSNNAERSWTFRYGDLEVADWAIGYETIRTEFDSTGSWNWDIMNSSDQRHGWGEQAIVSNARIAPVSGESYSLGYCLYPATALEDAGEQVLWITANGGNDPAGILAAGMPLYDDTLFYNAASYYALYENDDSAQKLGSTDSPIQLGKIVPDEAVNLALVNIAPWTSKQAVSTFDLSDQNSENITPKLHGDLLISNFVSGDGTMISNNALDSDEVRISSTAIYREENPNIGTAYFGHLIGAAKKAVYLKNSPTHLEIEADEDLRYKVYNSIQKSISITRFNGKELSFEEFPYNLVATDKGPEGEPLRDNYFTVIIQAQNQTINESVLISYPSIDLDDGTIVLQDTEIYDPFPLMKRVPYQASSPSGDFALSENMSMNGYDLIIYKGNMDGYSSNNQADL